MTREEMKNIIIECSGIAGETEFNRLSKVEFINWFRENIKYNGAESKAKGKEVIRYLWQEVRWERKERAYYERKYELMKELYGITSSAWDMLHNPSQYVINACFCPKNQKTIVSEYLEWEDFVEHAKKLGIAYYMGIDSFLRKYHDLVYSKLSIDTIEEDEED